MIYPLNFGRCQDGIYTDGTDLRLWELILKDPACSACEAEMERARRRLEKRTDRLSREAHDAYWEYPTCFGVFHGRFMELVCREMRFPEEK